MKDLGNCPTLRGFRSVGMRAAQLEIFSDIPHDATFSTNVRFIRPATRELAV